MVRLVQKLIELRKEHRELAVYPAEDHGFREPSSWADESKRIFRLFQTTLEGRSVRRLTHAGVFLHANRLRASIRKTKQQYKTQS
jgi:hypothetical protein